MAEDWRTAYGRVKMELDEYRDTIVPALMERVQELERRWIPVTERFPHAEYGESDNVLTYNELGVQRVLYFDGGCWCYPSGEIYDKPFHVTHWMEMPEPPKESDLRGDTD